MRRRKKAIRINTAVKLDVLGDNPRVGIDFKPSPPFGQYITGRVTRRKGRRYVTLYTKSLQRRRMACARYLKVVDHYQKTGIFIDDPDLHVHHKNENRTDDRLDNLEFIHTEHHKEAHERLRVQKKILICPVDKVAFAHVGKPPIKIGFPLCCSYRCELTLRQTLRPVEKYQVLLQQLADHQTTYSENDGGLLEFDLQTHVGGVHYCHFLGASEAEQIQRIKDALQDKLSVQDITTVFHITPDRYTQLLELGRLRKQNTLYLLRIRTLLREGRGLEYITRDLKIPLIKLTRFMDQYRPLIYPL